MKAQLPEIGTTVKAYGDKYVVICYEKNGKEIVAIGKDSRGVERAVAHRPADADELALPDGERNGRLK